MTTSTAIDTLVSQLGRYVGFTDEIARTARRLRAHALSYAAIQERWTSVQMDDATTAATERREAELEAKILDLVQYLPAPDEGPWQTRFEGDPRGWTVRLIAPDGHEIGLDAPA